MVIPKIKSAKPLYLIFLFLCLELGYSAYITSNVAVASAVALGMEKGSELKTDKALIVEKEGEEDTFYRVAWHEPFLSTALLYDLNGIGYYDDIGNSYVTFIDNVIDTSQNINHGFAGYREYWMLDILLGVKYRAFYDDEIILTNQYEKLSSYEDGGMVYENKNAFSMGVMYDEYLTYEQMDALDEEEKQFNLLNAIVTDGNENGEVIEYPGNEIQNIAMNCNIEGAIEEISENAMRITIPNETTTIIIPIENSEKGNYKIECYLYSKNYDFDICSIQWYDGAEWHYADSIDDKEWFNVFCVNDEDKTVIIKNAQPKLICIQFANGEDEVIIQDFRISVYDEEKMNEAINALVEDRQEQGMLEIDEFSDTKIIGHVDCTKSGTMFLSIPYHEGWSAYVDGQKVEIQKINYGFSGIALDEGEHEIILEFNLPGQKLGIGITIAAFLVLITVSIGVALKNAKRK